MEKEDDEDEDTSPVELKDKGKDQYTMNHETMKACMNMMDEEFGMKEMGRKMNTVETAVTTLTGEV